MKLGVQVSNNIFTCHGLLRLAQNLAARAAATDGFADFFDEIAAQILGDLQGDILPEGATEEDRIWVIAARAELEQLFTQWRIEFRGLDNAVEPTAH